MAFDAWEAVKRVARGRSADRSTPESSVVRYGCTTIEYAIHRGARRKKTVAVCVDPADGVSVRAPLGTPVARLDAIVHKKARWILERQRRHEELRPRSPAREFVSGETFLYLGRQYRLKLERGGSGEGGDSAVKLRGRYLRVAVDGAETGAVDGSTQVREALIRWYRGHALERIPERVAYWAPLLELQPLAILIRDQRKPTYATPATLASIGLRSARRCRTTRSEGSLLGGWAPR